MPVGKKALRDLRRRLGPAPMRALFEVVALPRDPEPGRDLRHGKPGTDLENSPVALLDNRHLHQCQSQPPVSHRPQTTSDRKADKRHL